MLLEKAAGLGVVGVTGHDVPGDRLVEVAGVRRDLLREDLEQRLVLDRGDRVLALRPFIPKPRPLTARHQERGHLAASQQLLAASAGVGIELLLARPWLARIRLDRPDVVRDRNVGLLSHILGGQIVQMPGIQCFQLPLQLLLAGGIEAVEEAENLSLSGRFPLPSQCRDVHVVAPV